MLEARAPVSYQMEPDFAARQSLLWSVAWLVGGVTVTLLTMVLLVRPGLALGLPYLGYGRLRGVADTAVVFGWLGTAGFAAVYALLPRLGEVQLHNEALGAASTLTWSVVLTGGIAGLVLGVNQGRPLAELGSGADLAMVVLLVFVLYNAGVTAVRRREGTLYASGWFLLAAAFLAPIVFVVGNLPALSGVADAIASGFYLNGLWMLWLLPMGLGIAHYIVPVETGGALWSVRLARVTFWSLVFVGGWGGARYLVHSPVPPYLQTIGVAMTAVLLLPALSALANLGATVRGRWDLIVSSIPLRFAVVGLVLAPVWVGLELFSALPSVSRWVGLTAWGDGVRLLGVFGVLSSFAFALVYHFYPLMVGRDWYSRSASLFHFWATLTGVAVAVVALVAAGGAQAAAAGASASPSALAAGASVAEGVVSLFRTVAAGGFGLLALAQYVLTYNLLRTARSGPYVQLVVPAPASVGTA